MVKQIMDNIDGKFGICQGRLTEPPNGELQWFPQEKWQDEFYNGSDLGYSFIEILAERNHNSINPIWNENGRNVILEVSRETNLNIYSACLDYIIDHSFISDNRLDNDVLNYTINFIDNFYQIGGELVVLPFLEKSNLSRKNFSLANDFLRIISEYASKKNIKISIESIASPKLINNLLENFTKSKVGCVFDTGNRVLINKDLAEEIIYLSKYINHVHLKDRDINKNNIIIGTGVVDFLSVFTALKKIKYDGKFSFESNRGKNTLKTAKHNLDFARFIFEEVYS